MYKYYILIVLSLILLLLFKLHYIRLANLLNLYDIPDFKSYAVTSEDLDNYLGIYSSKEFPLKITITKDGATLIAQATGQPSFPLKATDKDIFKFDQAGIVLEFNPTAKTMILKQGGGQYTLMRE